MIRKLQWPVLILSLLFSACSETKEQANRTEQTLELYSWWTNPGEADALDALLGLYGEDHPNTTVINAAVKDSFNARTQLHNRMVNGNPPDTFQVVGGWDLLQWVLYNGQDDQDSKLESLEPLATANNWHNVLPKPIIDVLSSNSRMYAVPVGIHRCNALFFNPKIFAEQGLRVPATLAEFLVTAQTLQAKGIVPLVLGTKEGWVVTQLFLDGLLIARAGAEFRNSYLEGRELPDDPRISETLNDLAQILEFTNSDRDSLTWNQAAQLLVKGTAAMTIIGDWAKGLFFSQGLRPDVDLGQTTVFGTEGVFVYLVDSFGLPKGAPHRAATEDFIRLIGSSRAQNLFNPIKGSTPPRTDADESLYDSFARRNISDLKTNNLVPSRPLKVANTQFLDELDAALRQFAVDKNAESVLNMLKNRYDRLKSP